MKNYSDEVLREALVGARIYIARAGYSVPAYIDEALGNTLPNTAPRAMAMSTDPSPFIQEINTISKEATYEALHSSS